MQSNNEATMKSLPPAPHVHDCNPTIRSWRHFASNHILKCKLSEYMKYFEIAIVVVVGSVENELTFFNLHEIQITKLINH
jgi:hypothetical protein